jgi:putative ABC transport system permease protein
MRIWNYLNIALRSLAMSKMRSFLTILGVLIGVAAVISVISLGEAQQATQEEAFASLGSNLLYIMPGASNSGGIGGQIGSGTTLTLDDAKAIASQSSSIALVAPAIRVTSQVTAQGENMAMMVVGVTPSYQNVNNFTLIDGEFITKQDYDKKARVAVLGSQASNNLFGEMNPVGQAIRINGRQFQVVGVLASKGGSFGMEDTMVIAPLTTVQTTIASQQISSRSTSVQLISVQTKSKGETSLAIEEVTNILRENHHLRENEDDDFSVISMESVSNIAGQMLGIMQIILAGIAGISLLVGGIGIMNIMLVSVTERTREIGLRKAMGAKRRDILAQFLIEAGALSFCGGAAGVILGWGIINVISLVAQNAGFPLAAVISGGTIALSVGISIAIGLISGVYPAIRAARLDPIEALRRE